MVVVDANFPLDEMHKTQLLEQVPLTVAALDEQADKNEKLARPRSNRARNCRPSEDGSPPAFPRWVW